MVNIDGLTIKPHQPGEPGIRNLGAGMVWLAAQAWTVGRGTCMCPDCSGAMSLAAPSREDGRHVRLIREGSNNAVNVGTDCAHCNGTGHEPPKYRSRDCKCVCCQAVRGGRERADGDAQVSAVGVARNEMAATKLRAAFDSSGSGSAD